MGASASPRSSRSSSIARGPTGPSRIRTHRDRMVGSSRSSSSAHSRKTTPGEGSSSVRRRAFWASSFIRCADSTIATRTDPSAGRRARSAISSRTPGSGEPGPPMRTWPPGPDGRRRWRSGWFPDATRMHARHAPHGAGLPSSVHRSAAARSRASVDFPMDAGPMRRIAWGTPSRPHAAIASMARSWPRVAGRPSRSHAEPARGRPASSPLRVTVRSLGPEVDPVGARSAGRVGLLRARRALRLGRRLGRSRLRDRGGVRCGLRRCGPAATCRLGRRLGRSRLRDRGGVRCGLRRCGPAATCRLGRRIGRSRLRDRGGVRRGLRRCGPAATCRPGRRIGDSRLGCCRDLGRRGLARAPATPRCPRPGPRGPVGAGRVATRRLGGTRPALRGHLRAEHRLELRRDVAERRAVLRALRALRPVLARRPLGTAAPPPRAGVRTGGSAIRPPPRAPYRSRSTAAE